MRQLNFYVGYRAGQKKGTINSSNLHLLEAPLPLPYVARLFSNSLCQGIYLDYSRNPNASKPSHTTISTKPSFVKRTTTTQRAADFVLSSCQSTNRHFKTATYQHQPYQEFQPTFFILCHRKRKFTQHLRPL